MVVTVVGVVWLCLCCGSGVIVTMAGVVRL